MATHNRFIGYGQVYLPVRVIKNEDGEYTRATAAFITIRGKRSYGNSLENVRQDHPALRTSDPYFCEEISSWKVNDMIEVKGTITSREIIRTNTCPKCGATNQVQGITTYINPVFCGRRETNISNEEGRQLLQYRHEISNNVTLIGMVTQEPTFHETADSGLIGKYQLAVMRRYRIKEDPPDRKADFIWIKSFGKIAEVDQKYIKKGTLIYIDGFLQTVKYPRTIKCAECGEEFSAEEQSMEVVPYAVEYLKDFIPQSEEEMEKDEKNSVDDLIGESKAQKKARELFES